MTPDINFGEKYCSSGNNNHANNNTLSQLVKSS